MKRNGICKKLISLLTVMTLLTTAACGNTSFTASRSIIVEALSGTVTSEKQSEKANLVKGEALRSGQTVSTSEASDLTLLLDSDKHVYAGENTDFRLDAAGKENSTNTRIELLTGTITSVIDNKLQTGESYEVVTPNATMAVRGTTFKVTVCLGNDGYVTTLEVTEGVVDLIVKEGGKDKTYSVPAGAGKKITGETVTDLLPGETDLSSGSSGLLSKSVMTRYNSGNVVYTESDEHSYDDAGNLISTIHSENGAVSYVDVFTYDGQGRVILEERFWPGAYEEYLNRVEEARYKVPRMYTIESEYGADGNLTHRKKTVPDFEGDYLATKTEFEEFYTYDQNGRLEEISLPEYAGNTRSGKPGKYVYTYDGSGTEICKFYYANGAEGEEEYTRKYDSEGRLIEYVDYNPLAGWTNEFKKDIVYDDAGNMISYLEHTGGEWGDTVSHSFTLEYEYDAEGNMIKCTKDTGTGSVYVYDYEY